MKFMKTTMPLIMWQKKEKKRKDNKAVFLDRDGVINQVIVRQGKPFPPEDLQDLQVLPGVKESLLRLKMMGFLNLVVTNQPDVARGKTPKQAVDFIHERLVADLALDGFYTCWHDDADNCKCRKPKAGLIEQAALDYQVDLKSSYMVGDRWRDVEAGKMARCRTIYLDYGYAEKKPDQPDFICHSLEEAVVWIEGREGKK